MNAKGRQQNALSDDFSRLPKVTGLIKGCLGNFPAIVEAGRWVNSAQLKH